MPEELEPFVVYRLDGGQMRCAIWQLQQGPSALALFRTADSAVAYRQAAALGSEWSIFQPARNDLAAILKGCHDSGILYAVLDPDGASAKRIFPITSAMFQDTEPDDKR